jgi:hypothetical protein
MTQLSARQTVDLLHYKENLINATKDILTENQINLIIKEFALILQIWYDINPRKFPQYNHLLSKVCKRLNISMPCNLKQDNHLTFNLIWSIIENELCKS